MVCGPSPRVDLSLATSLAEGDRTVVERCDAAALSFGPGELVHPLADGVVLCGEALKHEAHDVSAREEAALADNIDHQ